MQQFLRQTPHDQRTSMGKFVLGFIVGFVFLPVLAFLYVFFGYAPVATASPPLPLERYMAKLRLNARIRKEMPKRLTGAADRGEPDGRRKAIS